VLAFLPSLIYFVMAPLSVSLALWLGFAAAFAVGTRAFGASRTVRVFDASGLTLFCALALYAAFVQPDFGPAEAGLVLETGLLTAILWSMAVRQPFTIQYRWLRAQHDPVIIARAHTLLTAVWATCYAAMAAINAVSVILHQLSPGWAGVAGIAVFAATLTFTWQFGVYIDSRGGTIPRPGRR
jgi:hypothetical protein